MSEPTGTGEYEFSDADDVVFHRLGRSMRVIGGLALLFAVYRAYGLVGLAQHAIDDYLDYRSQSVSVWVEALSQIALWALVGGWSLSAGGSLARVATRRGSDITNVMRALWTLRAMFRALSLVLLVGSVLLAGALGLVLIEHLFRGGRP